MARKLAAEEVPQGWKYDLLDNFAQRCSGHTPSKSFPEYWDGGVKWISLADSYRLDRGYVYETDNEISEKGVRNSSAEVHPAETVVISRDAGVGKSGVMAEPMAISQHFIAWKCDNTCKMHSWFLYNWLQFNKREFERQAVGSTIKTIGLPFFKKIKIAVPPFEEQKKIAQLLTSWDKAVTVTEKLLANSQQQKNALMQQLLTGRKRLPGLKNKWRKVPLTDCLNDSGLRNSQFILGEESIMSVNKTEGMLPMRKQTIGKSIDRYKVVKPGWFSYNPMRLNVGSICRWHGESDCLVSPDYVVFSCNEDLLLGSYFDQFRQAGPWESFMEKAGNGSVRVRIYLKDLEFLKIPLPPVKEQKRIVKVLEAADQEIAISQRKLDCLQQEKKALMQQLLTGKRRVCLQGAAI